MIPTQYVLASAFSYFFLKKIMMTEKCIFLIWSLDRKRYKYKNKG